MISKIDFLRALTAAIEKPAISGTYNLGDDGVQTLQEYLDAACVQWGCKKPWRMPEFLIFAAASLFETFSALFKTKSPLTRDFVKIGMSSYYGDTSRMKRDLLPKLEYPTMKQGLETFGSPAPSKNLLPRSYIQSLILLFLFLSTTIASLVLFESGIFILMVGSILWVPIFIVLAGILRYPVRKFSWTIKSKWKTALLLGLIPALPLFHSTNPFYGQPRSAFKLATGIYPWFQIEVLDFVEDAWTDYLVSVHFKASCEFNRHVLMAGKYNFESNPFVCDQYPMPPSDKEFCYDKIGFNGFRNAICLWNEFTTGKLDYFVD